MDPAFLFRIVGMIAVPGWLLLVFLPRWRLTPIITACILPSILAVIYFVLIVQNMGGSNSFSDFNSLAGVKSLFRVDALLLAGWIHYLAFDLFVGSWEVRDARRIGLRHWFVLPCLVLTFMMGPTGLLLYLILRGAIARRFQIPASPADASLAS